MARLTKDGPVRGQKAISDSVSKAPSKILIIPAKELVQVIAKVVLYLYISSFWYTLNQIRFFPFFL